MGKKEPKVPPPSMPANIVDAKKDAIKTNVDSWFEEILKWRSELRGDSEAETVVEEDQQPLYLVAAESLARTQGTTADAILKQYVQRLEQSTYPTPDCLTPDEVLAYSKTGSDPRAEHTRTCAPCAGLLSATAAPKERLAGFLEAIRSRGTMEGLPEPVMPSRPLHVPAARRSIWRLVLAGVFVPVLALAVWLNVHNSSMAHVASIAVLPIEDLSGNASEPYLKNGMTSEITANLGTVGQLRVTSPESSMAFVRLDKSISEIAKILSVDAFAQCTLRREGDRLFVSTTLVDAYTNQKLGSESYQDHFHDALTLGNRLARAIAVHAGVRLTTFEKDRLEQPFAAEPEALEFYFQGRYSLNKRDKDSIQIALSQFQKATQKDPTFGLAYVGLADCYNLAFLRHKQFKPEEAYENAIENAEKARQLDPKLAGAYAAIALSKMWFERDWAGAGEEFECALKLNPNHAPTSHWYGLYLSHLDRSKDAIAELTRTTELDPLSPAIRSALGDALYLARDYEGAAAQYQKALAIASDIHVEYPQASWNLAMTYLHTRNFKEAISIFNGAESQKPSLALAYSLSGDNDRARQVLLEIAKSTVADEYSRFDIALVYAALGDKNKAFKFLNKAVDQLDPSVMQLRVSPDLDSLRSDPRFTDLVRALKFPESILSASRCPVS